MARALLFGLLVGFPIAVSPGPMFFLVLRRTLARGWRSGLLSGAGIATGDALYAAIAALGMTALINLLIGGRRWIGLAGGIAIALVGVRTILTQYPRPGGPPKGEGETRAANDRRQGERGGLADYASTLGLTLSNPPTILSFIAVFAGLGVHVGSGWEEATGLVAGVMLGSALWWVLLTGTVSIVRRRISAPITRAIGIGSGLALVVFGILISLQSL